MELAGSPRPDKPKLSPELHSLEVVPLNMESVFAYSGSGRYSTPKAEEGRDLTESVSSSDSVKSIISMLSALPGESEMV